MKRFTQIICLVLVLATVMVIPAYAVEPSVPWGSSFFGSRLGYLNKISSNQFQVWIEVVAVSTMDELGASEITVQRSSDNSNWTDMTTFYKSAYPQMTGGPSTHYENYVTYTGTSGYYYRAKIWFYAKKGNDKAEYEYTTDSIKL